MMVVADVGVEIRPPGLDDDFAQETGLVCGGQMSVYIEPIEPSPELYVIGAGHVGFHLARLAHEGIVTLQPNRGAFVSEPTAGVQ